MGGNEDALHNVLNIKNTTKSFFFNLEIEYLNKTRAQVQFLAKLS